MCVHPKKIELLNKGSITFVFYQEKSVIDIFLNIDALSNNHIMHYYFSCHYCHYSVIDCSVIKHKKV